MKWIILQAHEGPVYVDVTAIDAIGAPVPHLDIMLRGLYLRGGQLLIVLDTPENMAMLFETKGTRCDH